MPHSANGFYFDIEIRTKHRDKNDDDDEEERENEKKKPSQNVNNIWIKINARKCMSSLIHRY